MRRVRRFIGALLREWSRDQIPERAAAISYYTIFSLPAFLLTLLALTGSIVGPGRVEQGLLRTIDLFVSGGAADMLRDIVTHRSVLTSSTVVSVVGALGTIIGATATFRSLRSALNSILGVTPRRDRSSWQRLSRAVLLLGLVLLTSTLLAASLALTTVLAVLRQGIEPWISLPYTLVQATDDLMSFLGFGVLLTMLYRLLPSRPPRILPAILGALVATLLLTLGKAVLGFYIATIDVGAAYGVTSSLLVLLLWIYYTALAFLFGAEIMDASEKLEQKG